MATEGRKDRKVRRFTFRGIDEDDIFAMPYEELFQLFTARLKRKLKRYVFISEIILHPQSMSVIVWRNESGRFS